MPYNEFGEYIPDDLALDEMKYELAKKGIMPLRPGGSDVPYVASEVPQTYIAKPPPKPASTATNVPQAIADRLGFTALPQALLGLGSSFPAAVAKETGFPKVAEAVQYIPTSKGGEDILEAASKFPQVATGSHMGPGPLAEFYVPRRAFGLERRPFLSPDDVRVMGGRAIESGREIRNIPEDFRAAQEGLRRESVFGGPTLGARTQGLFDEIGDVMARREMQGLSPIPGIPDVVSPQTRMYAVRPANVGQMIDPTDLPTAKYGDTPRKVRTVQNIIQDIVPYTESDYPHNTSSEYYNTAVRDAPKPLENAWRTFSQKKINEMFPDAPDGSAAVEAYTNRFNQKEFALQQINMLSDFARSPEALSAIESVANERDQLINEYNAQKNKPRKDLKTDEERRAHEENVEQLELQLLQKDLMPELSRDEFIKRITPPTKEEYMRRAQAAKDYLEGTFKKDIAKYIGTSQGPQMELAKRGITMAPKEELLEMMKKFESPRSAFRGELDDLGKERAKAGFNPRGEMYPLIVQKETEVKDLQTQLNDLNRQKSELRDLHRAEMPDEPDPARNPTETGAKYRALTNPMNTLIDKIEQSKKQLENFRLANAYETISDVAYTPVLAKEFKRSIPFSEKQFFPNLEKTPDTAQMFNVKSRELGELGIPFLAEMITKNIMSGRIPLDETKPSALPKSKYKEDLSGFPEEDILDYAKAVRESKAAPRAKEEAEAAVLSGTSNKFIVYEGKRIAGAASYDIDESTKTVFIDHLGSLIKGTGKQMVQEIENAVPPGYRVVLTSSDQAKKFWDKLGYKPTGDGSLLEKRIEELSQEVSKAKVNVQIDKIIEQLTKPRIKEETIKEAESRKGMVQLNEYAQDTLSKIPPDLRFKNSSVLELTEKSNEDAIRRQISFDGMVLDHCIAGCDAPHPGINPFSGERYSYSYPVDPATGKDRGDKKLASSFMKNVLQGGQRTAHVRDNATGLPVVTINMLKEGSGKYNLNYVSGYQNKAEPESVANYAEDVKDYLNLRADIIKGSGDSLNKWGILDTANNDGQRKIASLMNINSSSIPSLGLPRFVLESDVRKLALEQPVGDTHADLLRRRNQLNDEYNRIIRDRGEDDPEAQDLGSQIDDLNQRLQNASRQVATQGSPNLFRRMTTEALTNGIGIEDGGIGPVRAMIDNILNEDTYGLSDLWRDDYEFYPRMLESFTNAVRSGRNLNSEINEAADMIDMPERLARFQDAIQNFTPMQRELLVREIDNYAESNINQLAENLNPENPTRGLQEIEDEHYGTMAYLRQIETRRRGEDFTPEAAPAQTALPVPRDIAEQVVPMNQAFRDQTVQEVAEAINNSIRNLPEDRETLQEALAQYQRNPLDIPGSIEMILPTSSVRGTQNEYRRTISNYLIQQIQNRLGNQAPAQNIPLGENVLRMIDHNREAIAAAYPDLLNSFETIHNSAQNNAVMAARRNENPNEAYVNEVGRGLRNLSRGRQTEERVALIPLVQSFYDDLSRAQTQDNQLVPEHIRGAITRDLNELMMLGRLNDSASILTGIFEGEGIFAELRTDEQRTAASDFLNATLRGLLNDPDYRPVAFQLPAPAIADDRSIGTYRQRFTNELTGSRRAFDEVMQAERMTPGAINEAIRRTDGDARYNQDVMDFYRVNSPSGIAQLNNALRRYMEGNGFDIEAPAPARPVANQEALGDILNEALETSSYNYPENIVDVMQRDLDRLMTEGVRFDTSPDEFISRLNQLAAVAGATGLEGDATYATAMNELASSLLYSYQQLPETPGNAAPQLPAPAVNPIDELERRYGEAPRAPIDIVTDGLNRPITQFERDYSEEVQNEYREILREIDPAVNTLNLQNAMHHLGIIHDMLLSGDHEPEYFNLSSTAEMNRFADLIDRHFEVFRQLENLLDNADREPPEGRKRGGFIERATGVRSYSDLKRDKFNRKYYDDGQAALDFELRTNMGSDHLGVSPRRFPDYPESDSSGQRNMGLLTPDFEFGTKQNTYDQDLKRGGRVKKMNKGGKVNPVPSAMNIPSEHPRTPPVKPVVNLTDPGFAEELKYQIEQRQKSSSRPSGGGGLTDVELKNRLGSRNPTYNAGGKVSIDQMRYELLRK